MKRFIITGAPGAGKTAVLRQLELDGFSVVEEAATDVIAAAQAQGIPEPWTQPAFLDDVSKLQRDRQLGASSQNCQIQFHDRSVVCTAALAAYLEFPVPSFLASELERIKKENIFERRVFFIRNLGFITPTEARRITYDETVRFEKIHEAIYRHFGFELVEVGRASVQEGARDPGSSSRVNLHSFLRGYTSPSRWQRRHQEKRDSFLVQTEKKIHAARHR